MRYLCSQPEFLLLHFLSLVVTARGSHLLVVRLDACLVVFLWVCCLIKAQELTQLGGVVLCLGSSSSCLSEASLLPSPVPVRYSSFSMRARHALFSFLLVGLTRPSPSAVCSVVLQPSILLLRGCSRAAPCLKPRHSSPTLRLTRALLLPQLVLRGLPPLP